MSMIGSFRTGTTSVRTGLGSALTASGVCAPFPGLFLTDGASFKTGTEGVLTASEPPPCGDDCAPGQTAFDSGVLPSVVTVASSGIGAPTFGVYQINVGELPCPSYRMTIEADCAWAGFVPPPPAGGAAMHAYLADTGVDLATRAFVAGTHTPDELANLSLTIPYDGAYHHYVFSVYPTRTPSYSDFTGPLAAQSVYIWPPVLFPDFIEGTWNIKNVRVVIVTV